jgi:hypothetical protein
MSGYRKKGLSAILGGEVVASKRDRGKQKYPEIRFAKESWLRRIDTFE